MCQDKFKLRPPCWNGNVRTQVLEDARDTEEIRVHTTEARGNTEEVGIGHRKGSLTAVVAGKKVPDEITKKAAAEVIAEDIMAAAEVDAEVTMVSKQEGHCRKVAVGELPQEGHHRIITAGRLLQFSPFDSCHGKGMEAADLR